MTPRQLVDFILSAIHAGTVDPDTPVTVDLGDGRAITLGSASGEPEDMVLWLALSKDELAADEPKRVPSA